MSRLTIYALLFVSMFSMCLLKEVSHEVAHTILDAHMNRPTKDLFKVWHTVFQKEYDINSEVAIAKYRVFKANFAQINEDNKKGYSHRSGLNAYSDLTWEQLAEYFNIRPIDGEKLMADIKQFNVENKFDLDAYVDVDENGVSERKEVDHRQHMAAVRNQGSCGSCWAFATTSMLEGLYYMKNAGSTKDWFSPQQLVDCDTGNGGCNGGWYTNAINFYKGKRANLDTEYPYTATKKTCTADHNKGRCLNVTGMKTGNTPDTTYALLQNGPVAVAIAANSAFSSYKDGVLDGKLCGAGINHAVVAVGYGGSCGTEFWILRNSWGAAWGDKGHIKVAVTVTPGQSDCFTSKYGYQAVMG